MKINYINLKKQSSEEIKSLTRIFKSNLNYSTFVNSDRIDKLEKELSSYLSVKYVVALDSGTDALLLALKLCGVKKGDEVITPSNSFIASTSVIAHLGAIPIFVDVNSDQNINSELIEKKITKKTKVIMPVHLTGRVCNMKKIQELAKKYKIKIVEDAAQSIGSKYKKKFSGTLGDIGCFSTHPLKNLNACGDGGFLTTNNREYYKRAIRLRNHGLVNRDKVLEFGYLSRMDSLQAEILSFRLKKLNQVIKKRRFNVDIYQKKLNKRHVYFPIETKQQRNTYHTFVIQTKYRDKLRNYLRRNGIETSVHYPIPIHKQPAYIKKYGKYKKKDLTMTEKQSKEILTLPINQYLKKNEILYIARKVNEFFEKTS